MEQSADPDRFLPLSSSFLFPNSLTTRAAPPPGDDWGTTHVSTKRVPSPHSHSAHLARRDSATAVVSSTTAATHTTIMAFRPLAVVTKPVAVCVGFVYPAYASYKALEARAPESAAQWLTYWVVFSLFTVIEGAADWLISWVPMYYLGKLAFILWLQMPQTQGANLIYKTYILPMLKRHELSIDSALEEGRKKAESNLMELRNRGMAHLSRLRGSEEGEMKELSDASSSTHTA